MEKAAPSALPPIPAKRYFTIGEVSELCGVKPHVLRYWEQEFTQLKPVKRRGNRRYYQHHEVLLIRRIRDLLYEQGFTINGARNKLAGQGAAHAANEAAGVDGEAEGREAVDLAALRSEIVEVLMGLGAGEHTEADAGSREEYAKPLRQGDDQHA
ncbi:MerR family transcriptional regulator [Robbsia sp. Bb-Pol-6]|uniref:MerR family transcriptional regulator n=1 Tax=Robbsia betulipollinis TaxID=2981849 RepID=A0ABT3ZPI5_9BURK|nr:MerR family transcriptional regulator [Robbsia betulipollinis]MCY0388459.1 MerR family transcriptional regulator [Robbsia betulipollinis]